MPLEEKGEKCAKRAKTCRLRSQDGVDYGGPLGAGTIKQEEKESSGNGRWGGSQRELDNMGSQKEADGLQRATQIPQYAT